MKKRADGTWQLAVKLTPKAARNAIGEVAEIAPGEFALKATVTAVPEKGRANAALIGLIASAFGIAKSSIAIDRGDTSRIKLLALGITDDTAQKLAARFSPAR